MKSLYPSEAKLVHLYGQLEDVIQTFSLRLSLRDILAPDVHAMSLDQYRSTFWICFDRTFKRVLEILLVSGVLDDRDLQYVIVPKIA